jgi:tripartite-type tricarboxylate transporter receptor subunit TctC
LFSFGAPAYSSGNVSGIAREGQMLDRRECVVAGLSAAVGAGLFGVRQAAAQIGGTCFIVSGFPAGGIGDLISRPMAEKMRGAYATNVLVDSKVGAGGRLAVEFVRRSNPDGLTILQIPSSVMVLYPHIYKTLNYNPLTDFVPVSTMCEYAVSFTASSALPAEIRTVADFVSWARANPKSAAYGIPAAGSALHFAGMMLQRAANIEFTAVPYRGGAPLLTDMLAGVIPVSFNVLGEVLPHIQSGKLRSLAIVSQKRSQFLPDVPTMIEQGYDQIALQEWLGWFLPANTPVEIVNRLNGFVKEGLAPPETVASLASSGLVGRYLRPEEFSTVLKNDYDRWAQIVKTTGFTATE